MESSSPLVPFPLLLAPETYRPCTINHRSDHESLLEATKTEKIWLNVFRKSVPGFKKRAAADETVKGASERAEKFAIRYLSMLDDFEKDPESHGGPPTCITLCRLRDLVLRELGFEDIFRKVKDEENEKALNLLSGVLKIIDGIGNPGERIEQLIRGILAGNIFDLGATTSAEMFEKGEMSFEKTCSSLHHRPWVIDDLDKFKAAFLEKNWKKAVIFCDNAGADVILGILPLARELLRKGVTVVLAVNEVPSINDITYTEMLDIISKVGQMPEFEEVAIEVDGGRLLVVSSGNDMPVVDLSQVSQELAYVADDADLVILEGMGRAIETNLYARFKCDSLNIGMVKHPEVAEFLGGRLYDCVVRYTSPTRQR